MRGQRGVPHLVQRVLGSAQHAVGSCQRDPQRTRVSRGWHSHPLHPPGALHAGQDRKLL